MKWSQFCLLIQDREIYIPSLGILLEKMDSIFAQVQIHSVHRGALLTAIHQFRLMKQSPPRVLLPSALKGRAPRSFTTAVRNLSLRSASFPFKTRWLGSQLYESRRKIRPSYFLSIPQRARPIFEQPNRRETERGEKYD